MRAELSIARESRNHVSSVIGKLQVAGRGEAIIRARSLGYGQPDR